MLIFLAMIGWFPRKCRTFKGKCILNIHILSIGVCLVKEKTVERKEIEFLSFVLNGILIYIIKANLAPIS